MPRPEPAGQTLEDLEAWLGHAVSLPFEDVAASFAVMQRGMPMEYRRSLVPMPVDHPLSGE